MARSNIIGQKFHEVYINYISPKSFGQMGIFDTFVN
jgi:hypothetical protein